MAKTNLKWDWNRDAPSRSWWLCWFLYLSALGRVSCMCVRLVGFFIADSG